MGDEAGHNDLTEWRAKGWHVTFSAMPGGTLHLLTATALVDEPTCTIRDIAAKLGAPKDVLKRAESTKSGQTLIWRKLET